MKVLVFHCRKLLEINCRKLLVSTCFLQVDIRELLLEDYAEIGEEQILSNRYISFLRLFDQLSDKDKEDLVWVVKQRLKGAI